MRFAVVVFPGSNCDTDAYHAVTDVFGHDANYVWHKDTDLKGADAVILPGGFAHGDYLRTGAIARFSPVMASVRELADRGGPVLGICNGFQILLESGLLPGAMLRNRGLKFLCQYVHLRIEQTDTPFTCAARVGQVLNIPINHGEGNYFAPPDAIAELEDNRQVILRYSDPEGSVSNVGDDRFNPNGSVHSIAAICNRSRNVLGMMPHPERVCEPLLGGVDGRVIFESVAAWVSKEAGAGGAGAPSAVCRDGVAGARPERLGVGPRAVSKASGLGAADQEKLAVAGAPGDPGDQR